MEDTIVKGLYFSALFTDLPIVLPTKQHFKIKFQNPKPKSQTVQTLSSPPWLQPEGSGYKVQDTLSSSPLKLIKKGRDGVFFCELNFKAKAI